MVIIYLRKTYGGNAFQGKCKVIMYFRENVNSPLANLPNTGNDKCRGICVVIL